VAHSLCCSNILFDFGRKKEPTDLTCYPFFSGQVPLSCHLFSEAMQKPREGKSIVINNDKLLLFFVMETLNDSFCHLTGQQQR
jgi:hypothetical protein